MFDYTSVDLKYLPDGSATAAFIYVQLSQCRVINQLFIICPLNLSELTTKLLWEFSNKLEKMEELDWVTYVRYDLL